MDPIAVIEQIVAEYGTAIWMAFVSFVITGFALSTLRTFVQDLVFYVRARMSDIGYGQRIYYRDKLYVVKDITFRYIVLQDNERLIRVPISRYLGGEISFPLQHDLTT